jgi:hypothetical protein
MLNNYVDLQIKKIQALQISIVIQKTCSKLITIIFKSNFRAPR